MVAVGALGLLLVGYGLDPGDGSPELQKVACVAWGPDFKQGRTIEADCTSTDVCPPICKLLGADAPLARGRASP
jgi:hypothetical protein